MKKDGFIQNLNMDSNIFTTQITTVNINDTNYALVPLCMFHDIPGLERHETVLKCFGLRDMFASVGLFKVEDERKMLLAQIKYSNFINKYE